MSSYATLTDLKQRYGVDEAAQREATIGPGAVNRALADADAEIDSYLAGAYQVPLTPVPTTIRRLACAIARYHLLGDAATETARRDYEDARAFLRDVQAGRAQLDGAPALLAGTSGPATAQLVSAPRVFSRSARDA